MDIDGPHVTSTHGEHSPICPWVNMVLYVNRTHGSTWSHMPMGTHIPIRSTSELKLTSLRVFFKRVCVVYKPELMNVYLVGS